MCPNWSLGDIASAATTALGNRSDIPLSTVSFWVNEAGRQLWMELRHDRQETSGATSTTTNDAKMYFAANFVGLIGPLSNASFNNRELTEINTDQLRSLSSISGMPTMYALVGDHAELWPIPDSRYSLTWLQRNGWSDLTDVALLPSIATHLRPAVMYRAAFLMAENVTLDDARAQAMAASEMRFLNRVPSDTALRQRDQHTHGLSLSYPGAVTRRSNGSFDRDI